MLISSKVIQFLYEQVDKDNRNYHDLQLEESDVCDTTRKQFSRVDVARVEKPRKLRGRELARARALAFLFQGGCLCLFLAIFG